MNTIQFELHLGTRLFIENFRFMRRALCQKACTVFQEKRGVCVRGVKLIKNP
jgi:hypothetical protein